MKRQRLDASGTFRQQSQTLVEASYAASLITAKKIKQSFASKTLAEPLHNVLEEVIKTVNYVKCGALNTRIFRKCADLRSEHLNLIYYTKVRWLSKGKVVARVFKLREELKEFLIMQKTIQTGVKLQ